MTISVIKTSNQNYVTVVNGVETFISSDGTRINPVTKPCFAHLSAHNCRPVTLVVERLSDVPVAYEKHMKEAHERYMAYVNSEEYIKEREARRAAYQQRMREREQRIIAEFEALPRPIPATVSNIRKVLRYLNLENWGGWDLPPMTIGYSAHQYDCDGVQATTIILDEPITDIEEGVFGERKFKVGGKKGHLNSYRRL